MRQLDFLNPEPPPPEPKGDGLRYYQREAIDETALHLGLGANCMVTAATGTGKTRIGAQLIAEWDGRVLWVAHRDELIQQAASALSEVCGEEVGLEQAGFYSDKRHRIVVGSIQTVTRKRRLERLGRDGFSLLIHDEFHHALAPTYRRVWEFFNCPRLGLTATPKRSDDKALGQLVEEVTYQYPIRRAIDDGFLVPVKGRRVTLKEVDLGRVRKQAGDLNQGQLDDAMTKAAEGIVNKTLELYPDRRGIVFMPGVTSAEYVMNAFNRERDGSACFLHGKMDPEERRMIVRAFRRGDYQFLVNCMIATEGFDVPDVSLIVMGRPTLSRPLYEQMTGRGTRPLPGLLDQFPLSEQAEERKRIIAGSAKRDCVILDFVGNSTKHDLASLEDILGGDYSPVEIAEAKEKAKKEGEERDPVASLESMRLELKKLAAASKAKKVEAKVVSFDPFNVFHMKQPEGIRAQKDAKPATPKQLASLAKFMPPEKVPTGMTTKEAQKLLYTCFTRARKGLASYNQLAKLQEHGVDAVNISFKRASKLISHIKGPTPNRNKLMKILNEGRKR